MLFCIEYSSLLFMKIYQNEQEAIKSQRLLYKVIGFVKSQCMGQKSAKTNLNLLFQVIY
jgi:hypothetical protein